MGAGGTVASMPARVTAKICYDHWACPSQILWLSTVCCSGWRWDAKNPYEGPGLYSQ